MIMDDEPEICDILKNLLEQYNYHVITAENGNMALELYKEYLKNNNKIDLIIMDLTIPGGIGGIETLKEILKIDSKVNAIVASGYSNDPVMSQYNKYGFKAAIDKPFQLSKLKALIDEILSENQ